MRIPKNKIKEGKYTSGGEFVDAATNAEYKGYYYEVNGTRYAGKTYDPKAATLLPIKKQNELLNNSSTALFALISGMTMQSLTSPKSSTTPINTNYQPTIGRGGNSPKTRYFSSKVNHKPTIIKEIDEPTYKQQLTDPFFKVTIIEPSTSPEEADNKLPGLKALLFG